MRTGKLDSDHSFVPRLCLLAKKRKSTELRQLGRAGFIFRGHLVKYCAKTHICVRQGKPWAWAGLFGGSADPKMEEKRQNL